LYDKYELKVKKIVRLANQQSLRVSAISATIGFNWSVAIVLFSSDAAAGALIATASNRAVANIAGEIIYAQKLFS